MSNENGDLAPGSLPTAEEQAEFEKMMDELGLKGPQRTAMQQLPIDRKRYLISQNRLHSTPSKTTSKQEQPTSPGFQSASYGPSSATSIIPRIVPQLTGGVMRRFSLSTIGWGDNATTPTSPPLSLEPTSDLEISTEGTGSSPTTPTAPEPTPLVPQTTGSLWSWWGAGSTINNPAETNIKDTDQRTKVKSASDYVSVLKKYSFGIRASQDASTASTAENLKLLKLLISLRVHLSTAKLAWIEDFVKFQEGMDVLGTILSGFVGMGSRRLVFT